MEYPFDTLMFWMGATHFLMKTREHVSTEMNLHVLAYNLERVMAILGIGSMMQKDEGLMRWLHQAAVPERLETLGGPFSSGQTKGPTAIRRAKVAVDDCNQTHALNRWVARVAFLRNLEPNRITVECHRTSAGGSKPDSFTI